MTPMGMTSVRQRPRPSVPTEERLSWAWTAVLILVVVASVVGGWWWNTEQQARRRRVYEDAELLRMHVQFTPDVRSGTVDSTSIRSGSVEEARLDTIWFPI